MSSYLKNITYLFITIFFVLLVIIGFFIFSKKTFRIESRVKNVEMMKKNDSDDIKTVGWLRVQGTNIDYPIIYAPTVNLSYRTDDFVWTNANYKSLNNMVYISGHNIKNLSREPLVANKDHSRFEQLMSFIYINFIEKNQYIQYTYNGNDYLYKIYSVYFEERNNLELYESDRFSSSEMKKIINTSLESSLYKIDVDLNEDDDFISLNTCTRMFDNLQFVVNARRVRKGEKIELSNVRKGKEYDSIMSYLSGGNDNEA